MTCKLSIGSISLGMEPRIVCVLDYLYPKEKIDGLSSFNVSLLEIRADLINKPVVDIINFVAKIRTFNKFGLILTIRKTAENKNKRLDYYEKLIPLVDAVDTDISSEIIDSVASITKTEDKKLIISYHNFENTPINSELKDILNNATLRKADIIKIATMARTKDDVTRLLEFTKNNIPSNLVAISMGKFGKISRVIAPLFGSLFTYGCLENEVAPGQISIEKLNEMLSLYL